MAKIWCEKCNGKGRDVVCISKPGVRGFECIDKGLCPVCHGKCYTEEQMVSVAKVREWADNIYGDEITRYELFAKLDSMEQEGGE